MPSSRKLFRGRLLTTLRHVRGRLGRLPCNDNHALATSERRLSLALEATGDGLWDYAPDRPTYCSDSYFDLLGYPRGSDVLQAQHWLDLVHPDELDAVRNAMADVGLGKADLLAIEMRLRTASGPYRWFFLRGRVLARGPDGSVRRMIGLTQDIDAKRQRDRALHQTTQMVRSAFESSAIGMAVARFDGTLVNVNAQFCAMLGYTEAELLTMKIVGFTHPDDIEENLALVRSMLAGERKHYSIEKRYVRRDGTTFWGQADVGVVVNAVGVPELQIAQVQDISARKRSEDDLNAYAQRLFYIKEELERRSAELTVKSAEAEAAKAAAEQASRAKSAFLANMSHEIRTPMAAILGFADLLRDPRVPDDERTRCVETIARNGQHLLGLINDVLDLSKIEADKMTVECIPADPAAVLADVEAMTAGRAMAKRLKLTVRVEADVPRRVRTDPTRLRQVLLNLVSNAVKFTQAGEVRVEMGWSDGTLRVSVSDTGIGMSDEQIGRLFQPFQQADASTTRRFGGTGLGLAICRRLVGMLGGTISVASHGGKGSRFEVTVTAPVCDAPADVGETPAPPVLRDGLRILLAEDGADNQRLVSFYLMNAQIACEVADNGRIAVDKARTAAELGRPFDLVLMDMQMPEMDGYAAARALRAAGLTLPVIALTAHGMQEARQQSLAAGCVEHLTKPVDQTALVAAIAAHTARTTAARNRPLASDLSADPRFGPLIDAYVSELPGQVQRILDLARRQQAEPLRRLVHQIKGAGGGYGLPALSAAAATAEGAVAEAEVTRLTEYVDELVSLMRSVQGYDRSLEAAHDSACSDH